MHMKNFIMSLIAVSTTCFASAFDVVAHRGEFSLAPENTLEAFSLAWKNGAKYVEGDFHMNSEGEILVFHTESDLRRIWNINKKARELTIDDVKKSNLKDNPRWSAKFPNTRIPTIDEVFKIIPKDAVLVLEIKTFGKGYVEKVEELRKANGLSYDNILLISFDKKPIAEFKAKFPKYKALWLYAVKAAKDGSLSPSAEEAISVCREINADGVDIGNVGDPKCPKIDGEYVEAFKKAGLAFWVWTEDNLNTIPLYKKLGVDGVTTNKSSEMLKSLENR